MSPNSEWATASFRLFSSRLSLEELGRAIPLYPEQTFRKGDPVSRRSTSVATHPANGIVIGSGLPDTSPLEEHLRVLSERIEPYIDRVRSLGEGVDVDLFCGFTSGIGQGSFSLSPELLHRLSGLGLELIFDLYPSRDG
jgi:hypothetical protein